MYISWVTCLSETHLYTLPSLEGPDSSANFGISYLIVGMQLLDIIGFGLSAIGTFGLAFSFRLLLPRNVIPHVSVALDEVVILLDRAEDINALPNASEYRATLAILRNQVVRFRTESHRSPGIFQQLQLVFLSGLPYKLYAASAQIEAIRLKVELVMDEQQLTSLAVEQSAIATTTTQHTATPTAITASPTINVAEPVPQPQAGPAAA